MVKASVLFMFSLLSVAYSAQCPAGGAGAGVYGPGINSRIECIGLCVGKGYISPQLGKDLQSTLLQSAQATISGPDLCQWQGINTFCWCKAH